jgi:hypothetical protein
MMAVGMGKHSRLFLILFASNFCCRLSFRDDALAVVDDAAREDARGFARSHHRRGRIRRRGDNTRPSASFIANRDIIVIFFFWRKGKERKEMWIILWKHFFLWKKKEGKFSKKKKEISTRKTLQTH